MTMTSSKPYIMRALYEWIVDNDCTPYMLVAAEAPGVSVPEGFAENGQIVLNLSPSAVRNFTISNEAVSFEARFSGVPHQLYLPAYAVMALYAQENGQGMFFEPEVLSVEDMDPDESSQAEGEQSPPKPAGPPSLRVVK